MTDLPRQCTAHSSRTGKPCAKAPIVGGTVCTVHGGRAPQVKAKAAERIEAARLLAEGAFDPLGTPRDPGEVLLAMLGISHARAALYGTALAQAHDDGGIDALTTDVGRLATLRQLESEERDRAGKLAKTALDAGIAERLVRMSERQGDALVGLLEGFARALGLDPADHQVRAAAHTALLALDGGSA